jgi:hypothetical protein
MVARDEPKLIEFSDLTFFLIDGLTDESQQEGYEFIQRTIDEITQPRASCIKL